jgi:hypothetical protein
MGRTRQVILHALLIAISSALVLGAVVVFSARSAGDTSRELWGDHLRSAREIDKALFHRDRFHSVQGTVRGADKRPLASCEVLLVDIQDALRSLDRVCDSPAALLRAELPIEARALTDHEGKFRFAEPRPGAKTLLFQKTGFGPRRRDFLVSRDGYSNWNADAELGPASDLEVRLLCGPERACAGIEVFVLGRSWWRRSAVEVTDGEGRACLGNLGGDLDGGWAWTRVGGRVVPLGRWEIPAGYPAKCEWTGVLPGAEEGPAPDEILAEVLEQPERRRPLAGRWNPSLALAAALRAPEFSAPRAGGPAGSVHGFVERGFLPVRAEPLAGGTATETTASEAAEFHFSLRSGAYRVSALAEGGGGVFSRVAWVEGRRTTELYFSPADRIDAENPGSRILHGWVRWAEGLPVKGAEVYCQDAVSFRRYLRREESDPCGYFRFRGIAPGARYVVFAVPPQHAEAVRDFHQVEVHVEERETFVELVIHRLEIRGRTSPNQPLRLDRLGSEGWDPVWRTSSDEQGKYSLTYLAPGAYRLLADRDTGSPGPKPDDVTPAAAHDLVEIVDDVGGAVDELTGGHELIWGPGEPAAMGAPAPGESER